MRYVEIFNFLTFNVRNVRTFNIFVQRQNCESVDDVERFRLLVPLCRGYLQYAPGAERSFIALAVVRPASDRNLYDHRSATLNSVLTRRRHARH